MADGAQALTANALEMERNWQLPDRGVVGIVCLIITETALFAMFVAVYLVYSGRSLTGPYPKEVLELPVIATICLLSSSLTVYLAEHALKHGNVARWRLWWIVTIALGLEFLGSTGTRVEEADYRRSSDADDEFVWNHVLFIGWLTRQPRDCGTGVP